MLSPTLREILLGLLLLALLIGAVVVDNEGMPPAEVRRHP